MAVTTDRLITLLEGERRPRILVVGDVMLDRYIWGDVDRISFEAPIPVIRVDHREERLGGAGSAVAILSALDAEVVIATVTGDDSEGAAVRRLLEQCNVRGDSTLVDGDRVTTVKERLLGRTQYRQPQQMMRVDCESSQPIGKQVSARLLEMVSSWLDSVELVLVSDYGKGVLTEEVLVGLLREAKRRKIAVIVDPAANADYRRYAGAAAVTPNRVEAGLAVGRKIVSPEDGIEAARHLLTFDIESAVVKLDRDGIAWADSQGHADWFPVTAREVFDITGAGDAVLSAMGLALGLGADWPAAIELANVAGGLEVQRLGVAPLTRSDLLGELARDCPSTGSKIVPLDRLEYHLQIRRRQGQRIVMTNGCFDLLHPGHLASLQFARSHGDCLVVGLNNDQSVAKLKGKGRPILGQQGRAEMLAAMGCVDYVVIFEEVSVAGLVEKVSPDVLVKSAQYGPGEVVGHEVVERHGGRIVLAPMDHDYSTSELIDRVQKMDREDPDR